ncbi:PREDICTED: vesicle transport through interaction with t-SNAREs homolog 1B-like [Amphimedon queenslandica]|uniref:Vesicle transport v-SNARE N-terminal domain-containing protein n=1 Tax=Amphimedon queenslandica TaxID=400682 RepID=A0A1X7V5E6_AMPQE|nr:PREDICTED: vesicle transport through interaction with t-SNAREs homolog 1B-like [Amphimedon queenslandica]|eukprot:XP_003385565.1 PREDICTED: vesicle transport through interaction with t-SNAREs homolog 1B-like [Amphimedon queenslandica]
MSSERLERYEENLKSQLRDLEALVSHTLPSLRGDELRRYVRQAEHKLEDAENEYSQLQVELKRAPRSFQQEYNLSMARYKNELNSLKRNLISYSSKSARTELLSRDDDSTSFGATNDGYDQVLRNTEAMKRATYSVHKAQEISAETDQIADNIVNELGEQRQTLLRTRDRVSGFDAQMNQTRSLLRKIACQTVQNRFILIAVIIVEVLILILVTWLKFFKK